MDERIRLWLGAEDIDEDDRQALETVRDLISDLISSAAVQLLASAGRAPSASVEGGGRFWGLGFGLSPGAGLHSAHEPCRPETAGPAAGPHGGRFRA